MGRLEPQNKVSGVIKWSVLCHKMGRLVPQNKVSVTKIVVSGVINCVLVLNDKVTLFVV